MDKNRSQKTWTVWSHKVFSFGMDSTKVPQGMGANQVYSRLSTTHGHITDCKLDSVVYAGVCV